MCERDPLNALVTDTTQFNRHKTIYYNSAFLLPAAIDECTYS
jgi:hypothetical protein